MIVLRMETADIEAKFGNFAERLVVVGRFVPESQRLSDDDCTVEMPVDILAKLETSPNVSEHLKRLNH